MSKKARTFLVKKQHKQRLGKVCDAYARSRHLHAQAVCWLDNMFCKPRFLLRL